MFIHSVYFWLKPDLTPEQLAAFEAGMRSLGTIEPVKSIAIGKPAGTDRSVVERSYSYALIEQFDDQAGQDIYQDHPVHLAFIERCSSLWTRVQVFDCETL